MSASGRRKQARERKRQYALGTGTLDPTICHVCGCRSEHCELHHVPLCGVCCATASPPWRGAAYRGTITIDPMLGDFMFIRQYVRFTGPCIRHDANTYEYPILVCVETFEKVIRPQWGRLIYEIQGLKSGQS